MIAMENPEIQQDMLAAVDEVRKTGDHMALSGFSRELRIRGWSDFLPVMDRSGFHEG
jgi:hypothetical protein